MLRASTQAEEGDLVDLVPIDGVRQRVPEVIVPEVLSLQGCVAVVQAQGDVVLFQAVPQDHSEATLVLMLPEEREIGQIDVPRLEVDQAAHGVEVDRLPVRHGVPDPPVYIGQLVTLRVHSVEVGVPVADDPLVGDARIEDQHPGGRPVGVRLGSCPCLL